MQHPVSSKLHSTSFSKVSLNLLTQFARLPLAAGHFQEGLEILLKLISNEVFADDVELLLRGPLGNDLFMAGFVGRDYSAFSKKMRFSPREGFPGLAFMHRRIVFSTDILNEPLFVRPEVIKIGIKTFVSIPISCGEAAPLGCLNIAWRQNDIACQKVGHVLLPILNQMSNFVAAEFFYLRELVSNRFNLELKKRGDQIEKAILNSFVSVGRAGSGALMMKGLDRGARNEVIVGERPPSCSNSLCPAMSSKGDDHNVQKSTCLNLIDSNFKDESDNHGSYHSSADVRCVRLDNHDSQKGIVLLRLPKSTANVPYETMASLQLLSQTISPQNLSLNKRSSSYIEMSVKKNAPLEVRCFGPFEILLEGKPLGRNAFSRRRGLTALKILLLHAKLPVHRERLIEWLWPKGGSSDLKVNRLFGAIHSLRIALEPTCNDQNWQYILRNDDHYIFDPGQNTFVDLIRFRDLMAALRNGKSQSQEELIKNLEEVTSLYRGSLFEEDLYEEWCSDERLQLEYQYIDALLRLATLQFHREDFERCLQLVQKAQGIDPLREDLHHLWVASLKRLGRTKEANRYQQEFVRLLQADIEDSKAKAEWSS